ncbi:Spy/CpxP family protein refolding chaperone [Ideonella sp.]|uniref:Spy/CpxP family protein refolding chaperone n=1 Tax=Ideonella sp. TaxID=1929293 RepID=UPI0035B16B28
MRTWIKNSLIALLGASTVLGGLAVAHGARGGCGHGHGAFSGPMNEADAARWRERMLDRASRELALDATQRDRLSALMDAWRQQRQALAPAGADPRAALAGFIAGERFDAAGAQAWALDKLDSVREGSPALIAATAAFYDSLRPEQQQQLRGLLAHGPRAARAWGG